MTWKNQNGDLPELLEQNKRSEAVSNFMSQECLYNPNTSCNIHTDLETYY